MREGRHGCGEGPDPRVRIVTKALDLRLGGQSLLAVEVFTRISGVAEAVVHMAALAAELEALARQGRD